MTTPPDLRLVLRDFRALHAVDWRPQPGVNLLTGPNGSGKTTLLSAFKLLRGPFTFGFERALGIVKGVHLRRRGVPPENPVHFELHLGEVAWTLDLPVDPRGLVSHVGEQLTHGDEVVLRAAIYQQEWYLGAERRTRDDLRCCARVAWDHSEPAWMRPFFELLPRIRVYDAYRLDLIRQPSQEDDRRGYLHPTGANLWTVLSSWKSAPRRHEGRFTWVVGAMRRAFPDLFADLEFEGPTPHGLIFPPNLSSPDDGTPAVLEADGVLTGLLHLTAVAGAAPGSLLAFDEMENQLHPFAIRSILASMREMAAERGLTIILTTHSPVLINAFEDHEDQLYVLEPGQPTQPVALADLHDPAWFTSFSLGRRYERGDFGAPTSGARCRASPPHSSLP